MSSPMKNEIVFDSSRCAACGLCVQTCPQMVFEARGDQGPIIVAHPERCVGCLACEEDCSHGAIKVHRLPAGMSLDQAPEPASGLDLDRVYDMAIVGAGPAGMGAAARARRRGLDVAVLERLPSPRRSHHPDGGLLFSSPDISPMVDGPEGLHLGRFDLTIPTSMIRDRFRDFVFMGPGGLSTPTGHGKPIFPYVFKDDLVGLLAQRAQELGAVIAWNTRVHAVERDEKSGLMSVFHDGGAPLACRLVVSAEGSTGRIAERSGIPVNQHQAGWSYAALAQLDAHNRPSGEVGFLVGAIAGGPADVPFLSYWASGEEHTELACGPLQKKKRRLLERPLQDYLGSLGREDARIISRTGGPSDIERRRFLDGCRIFARRLPETGVGDGIIAAGDAIATCGMCTTLAALRTGDLAAEIAAGAIRAGDTRKERLAEFDRKVFRLSMIQGMKWMHNLLIEAPLALGERDLHALFMMLRHLDLTAMMSGNAIWPLVKFFGRNFWGLWRRPDLRRYLVP